VQRATVYARSDFFVGLPSLAESEILGETHDTQELRVVSPQARQVQLGEFSRLDLTGLDQPG
jgi:hypothetical protein